MRYTLYTKSSYKCFFGTLRHALICSIYSNDNHLYDAPLMRIRKEELGLNDGRFKNFKQEMFTNEVRHTQSFGGLMGFRMGKYDNFMEYMDEMVSCVAQYCGGKWSFLVEFENVNTAHITWTFEDIKDAMTFKLVIGNVNE